MTLGPWFLIDRWLLNSQDGVSAFLTDNVRAVLCGDGQVIDRDFVGASGDGLYADLTDELPTADGYTVGGELLTGKTVTLTGGITTFSADAWQWTITAPIAGVKYCLLIDDDDPNQSIIQAFDFDIDSPGTNTVTIAAGLLIITPNAGGLLEWFQI